MIALLATVALLVIIAIVGSVFAALVLGRMDDLRCGRDEMTDLTYYPKE